MPRPRLLYLTMNNGTDTRINKEVDTLSVHFEVHFVGVQQEVGPPFIAEKVALYRVVEGRRRSILTLLRLWWVVFGLIRHYEYKSVHVINENLLILFFPFVFWHRSLVLDIFDSMFLRSNIPELLLQIVQRICYAVPSEIIVTDEDRAKLMPLFTRKKLVILENYPYRYGGEWKKKSSGQLTLYYCGSLGEGRGTAFLRRLLEVDASVRVTMAGWIYDLETQRFAEHPKVKYLGVIDQRQSMEVASESEFILCLYQPSNLNNIYASPNKIYDAIQAGTPVIINSEVRLSKFVLNHGLGVVLPKYEVDDYLLVMEQMRAFLRSFNLNASLRDEFTWEIVSSKLLTAHGASLDLPLVGVSTPEF